MQEVSEKYTLVQLKEIAKELNIKTAGIKKGELIALINNAIKTENTGKSVVF